MKSFSFNSRRFELALMLGLSALGFTLSPSSASGQVAAPNSATVGKTAVAKAGASQTASEFLKMRKSSDGTPLALQTAITRFKPPKGDIIVDLIGAVHIGEEAYYQQLNKQFELYDVVLYELVAPEGTRIPAGGKKNSSNPISFLQQSAQSMLGLESQLAKIDYQKKNFVHADLSPAAMAKKMEERGDNALTVGLSAISEMMRQQNLAAKKQKDNPNSTVNQLASESILELMNNPRKLKLMMASQFTESGAMANGLGSTLNQLLIDDRNEAAMKVLQKQLVSGKKNIAIFYGAAHMPDFEKRLIKDFGLKKTKEVWVDAWDLTRAPKSKSGSATSMLMQMLKALDQ